MESLKRREYLAAGAATLTSVAGCLDTGDALQSYELGRNEKINLYSAETEVDGESWEYVMKNLKTVGDLTGVLYLEEQGGESTEMEVEQNTALFGSHSYRFGELAFTVEEVDNSLEGSEIKIGFEEAWRIESDSVF